jgi:type I restriction enzyme, S subunit
MTMKLGVQEEPAIYKVLLEQSRVQALSNVLSKLVDGSHNPPAKQSTGHPMLSARNINKGTINFDEFRLISNEDFAQEDRRTRVTAGDVLLTVVGTIGRVAVVPEAAPPFALQRSVAVMTPTGLLSKYLAYQLQAPDVQRYFEQNARGTAQKGVYLKTLGNTPVLVPERDAQQRTITYLDEQLSRLDASVAALHRVQANLKRYRASVLKAACEGRLVPTEAELARQESRSFETGAQLLQRVLAERKRAWTGKRQYVEPAPVAREEGASLPEGWTWASLDELAWHSSYGTSAKCSPTATGAAVLRIPNVDRGSIDTTNMKYSAEVLDAESTATLKPGDLLIIRTNGSKALIGRGAIVQAPFIRPTTFASYLIRFRLVREIYQEWLGLSWQSPESRGWIEARASTSAGQHNVSMSVLATAPIPLPPLTEQHRIVAEADRRLSLIRVAEAQVTTNLARAQRLRQSILQVAFGG